jgi:hypothetical protein
MPNPLVAQSFSDTRRRVRSCTAGQGCLSPDGVDPRFRVVIVAAVR